MHPWHDLPFGVVCNTLQSVKVSPEEVNDEEEAGCGAARNTAVLFTFVENSTIIQNAVSYPLQDVL